MHHLLRGDINPDLWNQACDYAINIIVTDAGLKLPDSALFDTKYRGLSAKQIAKLLGDDQQQQGQPQDAQGDGEKPSGAPSNPDHAGEIWDATDEDGERLSGDDLEDAAEAVRRDIIVAAEVEKVTGSGTINISDGVLDAAKACRKRLAVSRHWRGLIVASLGAVTTSLRLKAWVAVTWCSLSIPAAVSHLKRRSDLLMRLIAYAMLSSLIVLWLSTAMLSFSALLGAIFMMSSSITMISRSRTSQAAALVSSRRSSCVNRRAFILPH